MATNQQKSRNHGTASDIQQRHAVSASLRVPSLVLRARAALLQTLIVFRFFVQGHLVKGGLLIEAASCKLLVPFYIV
jgi:hypothetical protein